MKNKAKITNIVKDGNGIRVFAEFTDGSSRGYLFESDVTRETIRDAIQIDLKILDNVQDKVENLSVLIGVEFEVGTQ